MRQNIFLMRINDKTSFTGKYGIFNYKNPRGFFGLVVRKINVTELLVKSLTVSSSSKSIQKIGVWYNQIGTRFFVVSNL